MIRMTIISVLLIPGFYYGAALSKMAGHVSLRMLNADILPFDFRILYKADKKLYTELQTLISESPGINIGINNEIIRKKYLLIAIRYGKSFFARRAETGSALYRFFSIGKCNYQPGQSCGSCI